jgi:beta-lactamase superfamily II metal-dependent hydrolase
LLDQIKPRLIVLGDSETPSYEKAGEALLQRLRTTGCDVVSTARKGATVLTIDEGTWRVSTGAGEN